jgi:hypothetical protein
VKAALAIVAIIAAGLGVPAVAIHFGDRQTLVAPPDAVLESFAREVGERRYDMATKYLSNALSRTVDAGTLRARFEPRRRELGDVDNVEAEIEWMDRTRASAKARIEAQRGVLELIVPLVWEHGVWAIDALPAEAEAPGASKPDSKAPGEGGFTRPAPPSAPR